MYMKAERAYIISVILHKSSNTVNPVITLQRNNLNIADEADVCCTQWIIKGVARGGPGVPVTPPL